MTSVPLDPQLAGPGGRRRARGLGIPFDGAPGPGNAITDVAGVEVGYETIVATTPGRDRQPVEVRTGVTVVCPLGRAGVGEAVVAGWHALNGNGEMTGTAWIDESGGLALPVGITNTHAVGTVHRGIIDWVVANRPALASRWLLPVAAETWDGYLNDINGHHVTAASTVRAIDAARGGVVLEGSVGGGTGMNCYGFKGGTGTSSRTVVIGDATYTVGVLLQANFGRRSELTVSGIRVGPHLLDDNPMEDVDWLAPPGAGSCITVVATDAPLLPSQCTALARRVALGLARTGTTGSHFSGDIFLAFSTANRGELSRPEGGAGVGARGSSGAAVEQGGVGAELPCLRFLPLGAVDPLHEAVVQCVEESVVNTLVASTTMIGRDGHRSPGLPTERLLTLLRDNGVTLTTP